MDRLQLVNPYTDETLMPFGKFKDTPLGDVPGSYLAFIYEDYISTNKCSDLRLFVYIHENIQAIKSEM